MFPRHQKNYFVCFVVCTSIPSFFFWTCASLLHRSAIFLLNLRSLLLVRLKPVVEDIQCCVSMLYIRSIPLILPYLNFLHVVTFPSSLFLMVLVPRSSSAVSTLPPFPTYPSILPYGIKRTYILAIRVRIVVLLRSRQFYLQWFIVCLLERVSIKSKYP